MDISRLWYEVYHYGYRVRSIEPENGLARWQLYKNNYSTIKCSYTTIKSYNNLFKSVNYHAVGDDDINSTITINGNTYCNNIEKYHFLVQLFRIPKLAQFKIPYVKILQLAYNAGQLQAGIDSNSYDQEIVKFVNDNNLLKIETYINLELVKIPTIGAGMVSISVLARITITTIIALIVIMFILFITQ